MPYPLEREYGLQKLQKWIDSRPPHVRALIEKFPLDLCYRIKGDSHGHYRIYSYGEHDDGTLAITVIHGADSLLPGVTVFGVDPESLVVCDCGRFEWA